jgi:hypothetical protein
VGPLQILRDRLRLLGRRLDYLERMLGLKVGPTTDWALLEFANRIADQRIELKLAAANESADNAAWHSWAGLERDCRTMFTEALLLLRARERPALDRTGPVAIARALLGELAENCKPSIGVTPELAPDVDDSFGNFVQIIRLRFPPGDIWDVPVVAHEFGHFADGFLGSRARGGLTRQNAVHAYLGDRLKGKSSDETIGLTYRLKEFFADVFATYAVGPAFAMSALLLRFDVAQAYNASDPTHPSYAARAAAILETMDRLCDDNKGLRDVTKWLGEEWDGLLTCAEAKADVGAARGDAADLLDMIHEIAPNVRYRGWPVAVQRLQGSFLESKPMEPGTSVRDLLNAAWMARGFYAADLAEVADRSVSLWRERGVA